MGSPSSLVRRHILSGLLAITYTTLASRRGKGATDASNARLLHARPNASPATAAAAPLLWGYEGVVPGPTLEVRRGEEVWVRVINELPEPTAVHWHGVRLANAMDGAPPLTQQPIAPGESFDYRFIAPDAGTYWYHPPRPTRRGLYGMLVVHETEPVAVDRDVALIFDDWRSDDSAASAFTVNGAPSLDIRARQQRATAAAAPQRIGRSDFRGARRSASPERDGDRRPAGPAIHRARRPAPARPRQSRRRVYRL